MTNMRYALTNISILIIIVIISIIIQITFSITTIIMVFVILIGLEQTNIDGVMLKPGSDSRNALQCNALSFYF